MAININTNSGTDTSDATATASKILNGYTAYADGEKITGNYSPPDSTVYIDYVRTKEVHKIVNGVYKSKSDWLDSTNKKYSTSLGTYTGTNGYTAITMIAKKKLAIFPVLSVSGSPPNLYTGGIINLNIGEIGNLSYGSGAANAKGYIVMEMK